jgi:hypothetical protein
MGKYVLIYYGGDAGDMPMEAWNKWFGALGDKIIDAGNPFKEGGKAVEKTGVTTIENFPANGYSIVKADSIDGAADLAKDCPVVAAGGAVRVYEAMPM